MGWSDGPLVASSAPPVNTVAAETLLSAGERAEPVSNGDETLASGVPVSESGTVQIPERVREQLGRDTRLVSFVATDDGEIVIRVPSAAEMCGYAARATDSASDVRATDLLREKRHADRRAREEQFGPE